MNDARYPFHRSNNPLQCARTFDGVRLPFTWVDFDRRVVVLIPMNRRPMVRMSDEPDSLGRIEAIVMRTGKSHFARGAMGHLFEFRPRSEPVKWRGHRLHE